MEGGRSCDWSLGWVNGVVVVVGPVEHGYALDFKFDHKSKSPLKGNNPNLDDSKSLRAVGHGSALLHSSQFGQAGAELSGAELWQHLVRIAWSGH
jgi:hypothetical protein